MVEERYASLIANASDVIMIVAVDGVLRFVSPACRTHAGLRPEDLIGRSLFQVWAGMMPIACAPFWASRGLIRRNRRSGRATDRTEQDRAVLESVGSNLTDDPAVQGLALNFRDISERKALEEQLRQLAFHDPLTLLANRNLFSDRVQHALALVQRGQSHGRGHVPGSGQLQERQ